MRPIFATARSALLALLAVACSQPTTPPAPASAKAPAYAPAPKPPGSVQVFTDCPDCPQMVALPPGSFDMGASPEEHHWYGVPATFADEESPRHRVTIARGFAIGRTEVTRSLYARFVAETKHPDDPKGCAGQDPKADVWSYRRELSWRHPGIAAGDDFPVNCVSWLDGQAFAAWLSKKSGRRYRLPTEAEWEYAARGGTSTAAYWGDASEAMCTRANVMNSATYKAMRAPDSWKSRLMCSGETTYTVPVGSYPPNPFGLSDMIGNVWEWVEDCSHNSYVGAPADGSAWNEDGCTKRVLRGGGFHSAPFFGRAASREGGQIPDHVGQGAGLRIVRDLDGPPPATIRIATARPVVGDPVAGERQFAPCSKCHQRDAGGDQSLGPVLHGVMGRKAGVNRPDFAYSPAMKRSTVTWTDAALDAWIEDPAALIPGNEMTFAGQADAQVRANIVAYMHRRLK